VCLAGPAQATDFRSLPGAFTLAAEESLTNELWILAATVDLRGQTADDLFLMSAGSAGTATNAPATIQLAGTARGDVWAAGDSIDTSGPIERHARLLGYRFVQIGGPIGRNLMAAGGAIRLTESASIAGDALLAGRDVISEGAVAGKTRIYADSATLSGTFGGDVTVVAAKIVVVPGTRIAGNLEYRAEPELILDSNVALGGKLIRMEAPKPVRARMTAGDAFLQLALGAAAFLAGLVFTSLFPAVMAASLHRVTTEFWKSLLLGFVAFCLIPMTAFFLLLTLIGIPLSLLSLFAYGILLYAGKIVGALALGRWLVYRGAQPPLLRLIPLLALGLLVVYAAALLPFPIDILVWFGFTLPGMGALAGAIMDRRSAVLVAVPQAPASGPPPLPGA